LDTNMALVIRRPSPVTSPAARTPVTEHLKLSNSEWIIATNLKNGVWHYSVAFFKITNQLSNFQMDSQSKSSERNLFRQLKMFCTSLKLNDIHLAFTMEGEKAGYSTKYLNRSQTKPHQHRILIKLSWNLNFFSLLLIS